MSRANMRAQNLAMSKLEDMKTLANEMAMAGAFTSLTHNAMVQSYAVTQTSRIENRTFNWRVTSSFVDVTLTGAPTTSLVPTDTALLIAEVYWNENNALRSVTMTGYVANLRQ
jgi:hypothetical protein